VNGKAHWDRVYRNTSPEMVSWYQREPTLSLDLIRQSLPDRSSAIIDVGGGASTLVDGLLAAGYRRLTVLDLSRVALAAARHRLGSAAASVNWVHADALSTSLRPDSFHLWHDRAVFHFLTEPADRRRYLAQARDAVVPGGYVLMATFAPDAPPRCSGLAVARYSPEALQAELGTDFELQSSHREEHHTPRGTAQPFTYCLFRTRSRPPLRN
jgi:SAM-dependent methyltransferase